MRTKRKTKLKTDRLEALKQVSQVITATLDPQRIVEVALQAVGELMEGMVVHLWHLQKEERILIPMGSYGLRSAVAENTQSIPVGRISYRRYLVNSSTRKIVFHRGQISGIG